MLAASNTSWIPMPMRFLERYKHSDLHRVAFFACRQMRHSSFMRQLCAISCRVAGLVGGGSIFRQAQVFILAAEMVGGILRRLFPMRTSEFGLLPKMSSRRSIQ